MTEVQENVMLIVFSRLADIWRSRFFRQVATLSGGTVAAQALAFCASPLLTRLYSAEQFGHAAVLISLATILGPSVTGRYELAISIAQDGPEAFRLLLISCLAAFAGAVGCAIVLAFYHNEFAGMLGIESIQQWLFLLPVMLFLIGVQQALQYWLNRENRFSLFSISQAAQALGGILCRVTLGWFGLVHAGLIVGTTAGLLCANGILISVLLLGRVNREKGKIIKYLQGLMTTARRYSDFPKYYCWTNVLLSLASAIPVFYISKLHSSGDAGQYNLTVLTIALPASILASAVGQIFLQRIAEQWQLGKSVHTLVRTMTIRLLLLGGVSAVAIALLAPEAFAYIFGKEWKLAGEYARITVFAFAIQFVASSVSMVFHVVGAIRLSSFWTVFFFITTLVTALACKNFSVLTYLIAYSCHDVVLYGLRLGLAWRCTRHDSSSGYTHAQGLQR